MINKVGLLPIEHKDKVWDAYKSFAAEGAQTWKDSAAFRKAHECRRVIIEFIGVWCVLPSPILERVGVLVCEI